MNSPDWQIQDKFVEFRSHWLTVIGEHLQNERGEILEYWRVEKADSVIVLPIYNQQLVLPPPTYRPGVGEKTLDFPGGRLPIGQQPLEIAPQILQRELGIDANAIAQMICLNSQGWAVNSSFSNQKLFGVVAHLQPDTQIASNFLGAMYPINQVGINSLLQLLHCLQCRAVLCEWWMNYFVSGEYLA